MNSFEAERVRIAREHADHPFADTTFVDGCPRCAEEWWSCFCNPSRPFRQPTQAELELAREERLSRHERMRGAA
ncbi:MAG: hypothetical protein ACOY0T_09555 [Myxococcota bacterium]